MKSTFNIDRVYLLLRRYFTERGKSEFIYWGITAIVFMLLRNSPEAIAGFLIVGGAIYTARIWRETHSPTNGINYFMIPATQAEKLVTNILISFVYYFLMIIVAYIIGNLAGTLISNLLPERFNFLVSKDLQWKLFESGNSLIKGTFFNNSEAGVWKMLKNYAMVNSVFLLGGIYFKRSSAGKTLLSIMLFFFVLGIMQLLLAYLFNSYGSLEYLLNGSPKTLATILWIGNIIFTLFFWFVSYVRLTEKEV